MRPFSAPQARDRAADPFEALPGDEAEIVVVDAFGAARERGLAASRQRLRAGRLRGKQAEPCAEEFVRAERAPALPHQRLDLRRLHPIGAEDCAVADLADRLEVAAAKPAVLEVDEIDLGLGRSRLAQFGDEFVTGSKRHIR